MSAIDPRDVLAQLPVPLLVLEGPELRIAVANEAARRLLGYRGPLGVRADALVAATVIERATHVLATGEAAQLGAFALDDRTLRATLEPMRDRTGEITGIAIAYQDVTEDTAIKAALHAAAREAEQASGDKDQLIASVAHELRAPLMTLLLWESLLRSGALGREERERALDAIRDSAALLRQAVDDVQDLSRELAGTLSIEVGAIELAPVVHAAVARFEAWEHASKLVVDAHLDVELGSITGDAQRLEQVVHTLLQGAATGAGPGVRIVLTARRTDERILIEIHSTDPHASERLLSTREDGAPSNRLAVAHALVRLHGGSLDVVRGHGNGAAFTVTLPAR